MFKRILLYAFIFISFHSLAQSMEESQCVRQSRYRSIYLHHIGIGIEANMMANFRISPRLYYSFGSFRSIYSVDGGIKYVYYHPMLHITDEKVTAHYLAPYISAQIHFWSWNKGCLYLGSEFAYNFVIAGDHYLPISDKIVSDYKLGSHHGSIRAKVGIKMEDWELNIHGEYDLSPSLNQKYIYESYGYDYDILRPSLYDRWRIGLSINYLITFKR